METTPPWEGSSHSGSPEPVRPPPIKEPWRQRTRPTFSKLSMGLGGVRSTGTITPPGEEEKVTMHPTEAVDDSAKKEDEQSSSEESAEESEVFYVFFFL